MCVWGGGRFIALVIYMFMRFGADGEETIGYDDSTTDWATTVRRAPAIFNYLPFSG